MKSFWTITLGTVLLMAGVIWLLISTHVVDGLAFLGVWWPIFIIVPFGIRLFFFPGKFISLLIVCLGVIIQLWRLQYIDNIWHVLSIAAPIAVILIALHMLFGRKTKSSCDHHHHH